MASCNPGWQKAWAGWPAGPVEPHPHVEPGWENALEAAARAHGALEVGRPGHGARGFLPAARAPPRAWPSAAAPATHSPNPPRPSRACPICCATTTPACAPVLVDWLHGCYTAQTLDEALDRRAQLQPGEAIYVPAGHAVTAHSVELLRPGLRTGRAAGARPGDRAPGKGAARPAADREEARTALVRAEAAYADAPAPGGARREASEAQAARTSCRCEHAAPDPAGRAGARAQRADHADLAEVEAQLSDLQERRVQPRRASKSWICSWPTARSAMPSWATA